MPYINITLLLRQNIKGSYWAISKKPRLTFDRKYSDFTNGSIKDKLDKRIWKYSEGTDPFLPVILFAAYAEKTGAN